MSESNGAGEENTAEGEEVVLMSELETALHYAFRKEVAGNEIIQNQDLDNLKNFVNLLSQVILLDCDHYKVYSRKYIRKNDTVKTKIYKISF